MRIFDIMSPRDGCEAKWEEYAQGYLCRFVKITYAKDASVNEQLSLKVWNGPEHGADPAEHYASVSRLVKCV